MKKLNELSTELTNGIKENNKEEVIRIKVQIEMLICDTKTRIKFLIKEDMGYDWTIYFDSLSKLVDLKYDADTYLLNNE